MSRPKWEVADVLRLCERQIQLSKRLPHQVKKTARAIIQCRTASLGGHILRCNKCGHELISYNSCRNRHCPKCQFSKREQWILDREREVLPVRYFHVVFTIPSELNQLVKAYPRHLYNILFRAAWYTIKTLGSDPKWIGGQAGMTAVLHTWGQNLSLHPHLHCLIPNGAYIPSLGRWVYPRKKGFLFPVRVMSKMFRGSFIRFLQSDYQRQKITWNIVAWNILQRKISNATFNVYSKVPFGGPPQVIKYLGRYSHRVAITNQRIKHVDNEKVLFTYRDYRDGLSKEMQLTPLQFCHRFLQHVLPKGLAKIRHYGILANRNRNHLIPQILLFFERRQKATKLFSAIQYIKKNIDPNLDLCPHCKEGRLLRPRYYLKHPIRGDPYPFPGSHTLLTVP